MKERGERHEPVERLENYPLHESMRGYFGHELYKAMAENEDVYIVTADLGFGLFDPHKADFPDRFINTRASEMAAVGIACGLAEEGKIPFVYSITPFLLYRPFELIRNYLDHEQIPVNLIGAGRNNDYEHDGFSHWAGDDKAIMENFKNIQSFWPLTKSDMKYAIKWCIEERVPKYINLRR